MPTAPRRTDDVRAVLTNQKHIDVRTPRNSPRKRADVQPVEDTDRADDDEIVIRGEGTLHERLCERSFAHHSRDRHCIGDLLESMFEPIAGSRDQFSAGGK
jgi:hypothetical protein